ncbi:hypothetical protein BU23DRAFT_547122 [Bimuria novae-zelandiae CBS 107.79]|uniref:Arb2 domain-containing protein n=1 Tax=Bimuria novae-zelandiae CBS 107.79 TaxID=1447943 RepID=A0A6A5UP67_9PLEO|nr:hypothetical protein BU23DRAFT_547122 [Bimuria novae-zelandiae CBS 107.79]
MFRWKGNALHPDAKYPVNTKELGFFIDQNGCFRNREAPELFFNFHYTNDDRHNEVRSEAMRVCHRREVLKRLAALGLKELYLPTLSPNKPNGPHIPILAPAAEVLKARKRVLVVINDHAYQDLGILAYRELQREGGVNGGSVINFVKGLASRTRANVDPGLEGRLSKDGAGFERDEDVPGLIVLNTAQLLYSHKYNKALSFRSWDALPRKSVIHDAVKYYEVENRVDGHRTPEEHIKTVFETVIKNPDFVSPGAEVYVVAIESGVESLISILDGNLHKYGERIVALALIQSPKVGQIKNPDLKAFLHARARHWQTSQFGSPNPSQCNALPSNYVSNAVSRKPDTEASIDWLEKSQGGVGHHAYTPCTKVLVSKAAMPPTPEASSDDGFQDDGPTCPTFGGGDTWVGECVFTQPVVQQAILSFFEDVARDPDNYCNPDFSLEIPNPSPEEPTTLSADSRLDADMLNPEKQVLLVAQEELRQLHAAFLATPQGDPEFGPALTRLEKLIKNKDAEIKELEEKAVAKGALGADAEQELRDNWKHKMNGEKWTEKVPGKNIPFAGVMADSNIVASAGCLDTTKEELAKLDLEDD